MQAFKNICKLFQRMGLLSIITNKIKFKLSNCHIHLTTVFLNFHYFLSSLECILWFLARFSYTRLTARSCRHRENRYRAVQQHIFKFPVHNDLISKSFIINVRSYFPHPYVNISILKVFQIFVSSKNIFIYFIQYPARL